MAVAVVFVQGFVVAVLVSFLRGEEVAEGAYGAGWGGDGVEGAEVHDINRLRDCEVGARQVGVQTIADGGGEDVGPCFLSCGGDVAVWTVLEGCAEVVVECVVHTRVLRDRDDVVRIRSIASRPRTPIPNLRSVKSLRPVLSRLNNPRLARGANKRRQFSSQLLITSIKLDSRINHLLLPKKRELIRSKRIAIIC